MQAMPPSWQMLHMFRPESESNHLAGIRRRNGINVGSHAADGGENLYEAAANDEHG